MAVIDKTYVDQAKLLLAQGDVSDAYGILATGGDPYAAAGRDLTNDIPGFLGRVVEKYWDRVYGPQARQEKWDDVARAHLTNYLNKIEDSPVTPGKYELPDTTFIEESYGNALESNGLSRDGAIDLAINQLTQPLTISLSEYIDRFLPGKSKAGLDLNIDMPDWHSILGTIYGDFGDRTTPNSGNFTTGSWQKALFDLGVAGLTGTMEYVLNKTTAGDLPEYVLDHLKNFSPDTLYNLAQDYKWAFDNPQAVLNQLKDDLASLAGTYGWAWNNPADLLDGLPPWLPGAQQPITDTPGYNPAAGFRGGGYDPLIFDLDGDGVIELTNMNTNGIHFDYWADGFSESTGWVAQDDGMLVWDINRSGAVDSVEEMFGSYHPLRFLMESNFDVFRNEENGFARLAKQDLAINGGNGDGKIDGNDAIWSQLKIWQDVNQDGVSQPGEMFTLDSIGMASIDVANYALDGFVGVLNGGFSRIIEGNTVTHKGSFTMANGATREVVDVWFNSNLQDTFYNQDYPFDVRALFLPTLRGYGQIPDLHIAMSLDNGAGGLLEQVQSFAANRTFEQLFTQSDAVRGDMRNLLMKWAGVDGAATPDFKTHDMYGGMQEFLFLRNLAGQDALFMPTWFDAMPWMPWVSDGVEAVFDSWENVLDNFSARMIFQSGGSALFGPGAKYNPFTDVFEGPLTLSQTAIAQLQAAAISQSDREGFWHSVAVFIDNVKGVANLTATEQSWLDTAISAGSAGALSWSEIVGTLGDQVMIMQSTDNVFTGSRYDDVMDKYWLVVGDIQATGGAGDDRLFGWNGSDTLDGGVGNDVLTGGWGNDTYRYDSGHDVIVEDGNPVDFNAIEFAAGIAASDLTVHLARMDSAVRHFFIEVEGRGTLTVMNNRFGVHQIQYIDELRFADGAVIAMTNMAATIHGTNNDDQFIDGSSWRSGMPSTINGYDGDDRLNAYYEQGSILDGGPGNDWLTGGAGVDTFIISPGDDFIDVAYGGGDRLLVPTGYSFSDVRFYRVQGDVGSGWRNAEIEVAGLGSMTIKAHFDNQPNTTIPTLQFANGTTVNLLTQDYLTVGTSGDDFITDNWLWPTGDIYVFGQGNDTVLESFGGTDTILFGEGISLSNLSIQRVSGASPSGHGTNNLVIKDQSGNSLTVVNHFQYSFGATQETNYSIEKLKFSDGTIVNLSDIEIETHGTEGNDQFAESQTGDASLNDKIFAYGGNDNISPGEGNDISYGGDGNDQIYDWLGNDILYGEAGHDTLNSGDGDDQLFGGTENDRLQGGDGNDTLDGGAGDDSLDGGPGIDLVLYSTATSAVTVSLATTAAQNTLGAGIDTLIGIENLTGSSFNDTLTGAANDNVIDGGNGNDLIQGGLGNDTLNGGVGTDSVSYTNATLGVTVNLATTTAQNTVGAGTDTVSNFENLRGSNFNDTLTGDAKSNILIGGLGNDVLNGGAATDIVSYETATAGVTVSLLLAGAQNTIGAGIDTLSNFENLRGSNFNDTLTGNGGTNILTGGAGDDVLNGDAGSDTASYETSAAGVTVSLAIAGAQNTIGAGTDTLSNFENLRGSNFNDTLTGNAASNVLIGHLGNDLLDGGAGTDTASYETSTTGVTVSLAIAGAQNTIGAGTDTLLNFEHLRGGVANDTLTGNGGANIITGGLGNDMVDGGAGTDTASYDTAFGGVTVNLGLAGAQNTVNAGTDTLSNFENLKGSIHNDTLTGNAASNVIIGDQGNDILNGDAGIDTASYETAKVGVTVSLAIAGTQNTVGAGTDTLSNFENLRGGNFNDTLTGNAGANQLTGGLGNDTMAGGSGADSFVFNTALNVGTNNDVITDFSPMDDTLVLENSIFTKFTATGAIPAGTFVANAGGVAADANDYLLYNTTTGTLSYDADGNGAGAAVAFVTLVGIPALTAADFSII